MSCGQEKVTIEKDNVKIIIETGGGNLNKVD